MRRIEKLLFTSALALTGVGLLVGGSASAAPCASSPVTALLDYASDVRNITTSVEAAGHDDQDILEVVSCVSGGDMELGMRVAGVIDVTDRSDYTFYVRGPGLLGANVWFENGSATYFDSNFDEVSLNNSTAGGWLTVWLPLASYGDATSGWWVKAEARFNEEADSSTEYIDSANLDTYGEYLDNQDVALEPTPFITPTVAITSVVVTQEGSGFRVVVEGTTQGPVAELRVTMGASLQASGSPTSTLSYPGYWREEGFAEGTPNLSVEKVGGSWAMWLFTRVYDAEGLKGFLSGSPLFTVTGAKVEVRALAQDGRWGHANQTFQPLTTQQPPGSGGSAPGGSSTLLLVLVAVVAAGAVAAALVMGKRKRAARQPVATPPAAPPPAPPPP